MPDDLSRFTKRQLYYIASDNAARMSDRYAAVREMQSRKGESVWEGEKERKDGIRQG